MRDALVVVDRAVGPAGVEFAGLAVVLASVRGLAAGGKAEERVDRRMAAENYPAPLVVEATFKTG